MSFTFDNLNEIRKNMTPIKESKDDFFYALVEHMRKDYERYNPSNMTEDSFKKWNSSSLTQSLAILIYFSVYERQHLAFEYLKHNIINYLQWCESLESKPYFVVDEGIKNIREFLISV